MNEDVFNMQVRKLLKEVGVTSQREIERAVNAAIESGAIKGTETLKATVTVTIEDVGVAHRVDGQIALA